MFADEMGKDHNSRTRLRVRRSITRRFSLERDISLLTDPREICWICVIRVDRSSLFVPGSLDCLCVLR
jgi:hypothetical protein